jgi:two-component system, NarL family, nitrate/nitrite response regulator NarL
MGNNVSVIILEPRSLVREGLTSLVETHSYRVIAGAASALDLGGAAVANAPKLVILSGHSVGNAAAEASAVRRLWPDAKIVLLFEQTSGTDLDWLLTSQIDACLPLCVSAETLVGTLRRILDQRQRVFLVEVSAWRSTPMKCEHVALSADPATLLVDCVAAPATEARVRSTGLQMGAVRLENRAGPGISSSKNMPKLSDREEQILKDLVKGHSNKLIARTCAVTEATVKVHIKSILRKARVANRTQAAVWALENGYADEAASNPMPVAA